MGIMMKCERAYVTDHFKINMPLLARGHLHLCNRICLEICIYLGGICTQLTAACSKSCSVPGREGIRGFLIKADMHKQFLSHPCMKKNQLCLLN